MTLVENYLCGGESVRYSIAKKSLLGTPEEIAATNMRIVHVAGNRCYDIKYGYVTSIGNRTVFDRKSAVKAAYLLLFAAIFLWTYLVIPGYVSGFADNFQAGIDNMTSPASGSPGPTGPAPGSGGAGAAAESPQIRLDLKGTINVLGSLFTATTLAIGIFYLAIGSFNLIVFLLSIKRGIVIETPGGTHVFGCPGGRKAEALELIKTVRASEEDKIRILQQCMPELFIKEKT